MQWRELVVILSCISSGYLHYKHVKSLHENHLNFGYLSTLERELSFRTEQGFYYSFYKQLIRAPSFSLQPLLDDDLTEFPDRINAMNRFNLHPEVILGFLYRNMKLSRSKCYQINRGETMPPVTSCVGLGEPAYFYIEGIFWLAGFSMMGVFFLAYLASGGVVWAGIVAVVATFYHHLECTRVMWSPPLRESFSYPFFVWQQIALLHALKQSPSLWNRLLLVACTVLFLLPWQFAQFIVFVQACAVFGCYLVGSIEASKLRDIVSCLLVAAALSALLQMGNSMLMTSILLAGLITILLLSFCGLERLSLLMRLVTSPFQLVGTIVAVKKGLSALSGVSSSDDDSHIWHILRAKFDSQYSTFDTKLYLCAAEFDFYDLNSLIPLSKGLIVPVAVLTIFRFGWSVANDDKAPSAPLVFIFLQMAAFSLLAGLIQRLKLFFTPHLILTASLLLHKRLRPTRRNNLLAIALLVGMSFHGIPSLLDERSITGEYRDFRLEEVIKWIMYNTNPTESFVGPMTIMATVRETTFRPIYNHPHYENAGLRERTRHAYSLYSRKPLQDIWTIHHDIVRADFVVFDRKLCTSDHRVTGCRFRDIWDIEDQDNVGRQPVCERLLDSDLEPYFRTMFQNYQYAILEVVRDPVRNVSDPFTTKHSDEQDV